MLRLGGQLRAAMFHRRDLRFLVMRYGPVPLYLVNPGPHANLIVNMGETEKAQIDKEERNLLQDLCAYRSYFCAKGAGD
jgi:hypothetical protein